MIAIRSEAEIKLIRESCRIVVRALKLVEKLIEPGIQTREIDWEVESFIRKCGGRPSFKGYKGFPASTCISIDDEVVHGIPGRRRLETGQLVSVDIGVEKAGYHGDAAITLVVGRASEDQERLIRSTRGALYKGIQKAVAGNRLGDVSHAIQSFVEAGGCSVVRDLVGHGIGRQLQEDPQIPNFGRPNSGPRLRRGMVLAIEPMVSLRGVEVLTKEDNWTVVTKDGSLSAHFEHTVLVTDGVAEILTI